MDMVNQYKSYFNSIGTKLLLIDINFVLLAIVLYGIFQNRHNPIMPIQSHPPLLLLVAFIPISLGIGEFYKMDRKWTSLSVFPRVLLTIGIPVGLFWFFYCLVICGDVMRLLGLLMVLSFVMVAEVILGRGFLTMVMKKNSGKKNALVVGGGWSGRLAIETVQRNPQLKLNVVGIVDDDPHKRNYSYRGIPVVSDHRNVNHIASRQKIKLIITAISYGQNKELVRELLKLKMAGVKVVDMPVFYESVTGQIPIRHVEDSWFIFSGGFDLIQKPLVRLIKRGCDIFFSILGIIFSLPIMLLIALLIKIESRGPVFFCQERVGQDEKLFKLIKFRSMEKDAEKDSGPVWASTEDYRVTRIGRLLRRTRLDEIPQFINVVRGEMSFIGPRPERPFFVEQLKEKIPYYSLRFTVKPGLTGWAQVKYHYGASTEDAVEKLKYDLFYIKNMSLFLDLVIMMKTVNVVLLARGS